MIKIPLRWADGEVIGSAVVHGDGRVEATVFNEDALNLLRADLTGISLMAVPAVPKLPLDNETREE